MNKFKKYILAGIGGAMVLSIMLLLAFINGQNSNVKASVQDGQGYSATRMTSSNASTSAQQIKVGPGMFGSVIITATSTGGLLEIYDGVISGATLAGAALTPNIGATTTATTTLASFNGTTGVGTYTFDIATNRSIFVYPALGFNGSYTITYK